VRSIVRAECGALGGSTATRSNGTVPSVGCRRRCRCSLVRPVRPCRRRASTASASSRYPPRTEMVTSPRRVVDGDSGAVRRSTSLPRLTLRPGARVVQAALLWPKRPKRTIKVLTRLPEVLLPSGHIQEPPLAHAAGGGSVVLVDGLDATPRHRHTGTPPDYVKWSQGQSCTSVLGRLLRLRGGRIRRTQRCRGRHSEGSLTRRRSRRA